MELVLKFLTDSDCCQVSLVRGLGTNNCERMFKIYVALIADSTT